MNTYGNILKKEIFKLENLPANMIYRLKNRKSNVKSFLARNLNTYGVALENVNNVVINESFVNVNIKNMLFTTAETGEIPVLYLYASNDVNIEDFIQLAENFLSLSKEDSILTNPISWVEEWKNLLGDAKKKFRVYDVIGELISLSCVLETGTNANWQASKKGVHDIETESFCVEVKSSTNKTETFISINSAFQLMSQKQEYLYFCRVEQDNFGVYSINNLVETLVQQGYSRTELEEELSKLGYPNGKSTRNEMYNLLELRKYVVNNETFPIIPLHEINKFAPKNNIIGYKITLDLAGIDYELIK